MPDDYVTDQQSGLAQSDDQGPSAQEEVAKLRSENANLKEQARQAAPVVDISRAIYQAPGGKEIFERARAAMDAGKDLTFTEKQQAKVEETAAATGLTAEQVQGIVQQGLRQHEQSLYQTNKAEKAIAKLHERGKKELEGYEGMFETDTFNRMVSHTLAALTPTQDDQGRQVPPAMPVPEDEKDAYWYAIKHSHAMLTAGKTPPKGSVDSESARRAAIAVQQTTPAGGPKGSDPDSPELAWAKQRGTRTIGKSFADS